MAREDHELRKELSGPEAAPYMGQARTLLGNMKDIMKMGGLSQLRWVKDLADGTRVTVSSIFGQDKVMIQRPVKAGKVGEEVFGLAKRIEYKLWAVNIGSVSSSAAHRINALTGEAMSESFVYTAVLPVNIHNNKLGYVEADYPSADYLHVRDYSTGDDKNVATRPFVSPEGSHAWASTVTEMGVLWLVGRVGPQLIMVSDAGKVLYQVPVSGGWVGAYNLNAVNNGKKAYFFYNDVSALAGVVEVDIKTGASINHSHVVGSAELGYSMADACFITGSDGNLYGAVHKNISAEPFDMHEVVKLDTKNYSLTTLADISNIVSDGFSSFTCVTGVHASVTENGMALLCNEFKYAIVDTKTGSVVDSGSTISLLGLSVTYLYPYYPRVNEDLHANGFIIPRDKNASVTSFGIGRGTTLNLVHLDLKTKEKQELAVSTADFSSLFLVEYIGEEKTDRGVLLATPASYAGVNLVYADKLD